MLYLEKEAEAQEEEVDSFQARLIKTCVKLLCKGAQSADKLVRFRIIQLFARAATYLGEIT